MNVTLTRWKLMAGVLGLSIVGVVAVANPQCPNTKKDVARETAPPSRVVPANAVEIVPSLPDVTRTAPAIPTLVPLADLLPATPKLDAEPPLAFKVDLALPAVNTPTPTQPKIELPTPTPDLPKLDRVVELPLPGVVAVKPVAPVPALPELQTLKPEFVPALPAAPTPRLAIPPEPSLNRLVLDERPATIASPLPTPPKTVEATPVKRSNTTEVAAVRVMIHLGTGQPKFDVLAGDDVLLKAVCDNVDIRSPAEKGAGVTPLKAGGKVRFSAPGCEGTCDNLVVLPSSGEVELTGNVKVHCRMGKGETEINAATMKFKLGSAPAYSVSEPGSGTVTPASVR